jgi:hypothetical protein
MSEFHSVNETQRQLAALCSSGKLGAGLEALIISAHHHISRITELEANNQDLRAAQGLFKKAVRELTDKWQKQTTHPAGFVDQTERELVDCSTDHALRHCSDELKTALETIGNYDTGDGCCPYGCDCPVIAKAALESGE